MTDGVVISMKGASIVYQVAAEDCIPEPAVVIKFYEGGQTFGIAQGESEISLNAETLPLLIKELRSWNKIAAEARE